MMGVSLAAAVVPPGPYGSFRKQPFPDVFNSFLKQALWITEIRVLLVSSLEKRNDCLVKPFL